MQLAEICETVQKAFMPSDIRITARCGEREKRTIQEAARALGLRTESAFIMQTLLDACTRILRERGQPVPFLDEKQEGQDAAVGTRATPE